MIFPSNPPFIGNLKISHCHVSLRVPNKSGNQPNAEDWTQEPQSSMLSHSETERTSRFSSWRHIEGSPGSQTRDPILKNVEV